MCPNDSVPLVRSTSERQKKDARPPALLEVRLFGVPRLLYRGAPLEFRAPLRALLLLAHLVVERAAVPRKRIAFALWPDDTEEAALSNMRRHVGLLEATLPQTDEPWIRKDRVNIAWSAGTRAYVDVIAFRELSTDAKRMVDAVDLYMGSFIETSDDEWVVAQRERFHGLALDMLATLVARSREAQNVSEALAFAQRALRLDPFREDFLRDVMWLRHASGDRIGALDTYRIFRERSLDELGAEPLAETVALHGAIASETVAASPADRVRSGRAPRRDNVPAALTSFHGRSNELSHVGRLVREERLVTLWGPGGVGKTRLALQAAEPLKDEFEGRVRFVDLAALENESQLGATLLGAMGLREIAGKAAPYSLVEMLSERLALIVLDNCEHLLDACARLCDFLLRGCPRIHILATSRQPLAMQGERVFPVEPFDVPLETLPLSARDAARLPAVMLFLDRAGRDAVKVSGADVSRIVAICRRLDGLPLAIELAAVHALDMGLVDLLDSLERRFERLTTGNRGALPRHRTLDAAIAWSVDQLSDRERDLFVRLSIFRGHFTARTALTVCAGANVSDDAACAVLGPLVARSLLKETRSPGGRRYYLLESIRAFAQERCGAGEIASTLAARHAVAYEEIAAEAARAFWHERSSPWMQRIEAEIADVRAALGWFFAPGGDAARGGRVLAALRPFWLDSGRLNEVLDWYERALAYGECILGHSLYLTLLQDSATAAVRVTNVPLARVRIAEGIALCRADDTVAHGVLIRTLGVTAGLQNDRVESERLLREAVRLLRDGGNARELAFALQILGTSLLETGNATYGVREAERILSQALALARQEKMVIIEARALDALAEIANRSGYAERAYSLSAESVAVFRRGDGRGRFFMANALLAHARLAIARGKIAVAREAILEAFSFYWFAGLTYAMVDALECCAELALCEGRASAAALMLGSTAAFCEADSNLRGRSGERAGLEAAVRAALAPGAFREAFACGQGLPFDEAIQSAVAAPPEAVCTSHK